MLSSKGTLSAFQKIVRVLLWLLAAILALTVLEIRRWDKTSDAKLIRTIERTLPPSAASGKKIAVISTVDKDLHRLLKGLAGISPEVDRIFEPKDLDHLAQMLEKYGQAYPIARLTFWGVGEQENNKKVYLTFTDLQETLSRNDFLKLRQTHPNLPRAFVADAEVVFFNCFAGLDSDLLEAACEAFLSARGGSVVANREWTNFELSGQFLWFRKYAVISWTDRPDQIKWVRFSEDARSSP